MKLLVGEGGRDSVLSSSSSSLSDIWSQDSLPSPRLSWGKATTLCFSCGGHGGGEQLGVIVAYEKNIQFYLHLIPQTHCPQT